MEIHPQRVLVAIDFSEDSREALLWAARYTVCNQAELIPLHVVHDPASSPGFYRKTNKSLLEPMQDIAEVMMQEFLADTAAAEPEYSFLATLEARYVPGLPPTRIVETAGLLDADLIVVGSRGRTGLPHRLVGSTSERVVELSSVPVVVVKSERYGKLGKKDLKRREKTLKKDRRKLKDMLGLGKPSEEGDEG
jgi:nucleotide-binding universal stress UspA family protein